MFNRLKAIRLQRGLNLSEGARAVGTTPSQLLKLERGETRLNDRWLGRLAKAFETTAADIIGEGPARVPLVGYIGAGEQVFHFEGDDDHAEPIEAPPDAGELDVAYAIRGDSMEPAYHEGDIVIVRKGVKAREEFLRRDCAVRVHDGPTLFKKVLAGSRRDVFHLVSYNRSEVLSDQRLDWAAPVRWIRRF